MTEKVTISKQDLADMIAAATQAAIAAAAASAPAPKAKTAKGGRKPMTEEEKAKARAKVDAVTVKNFKAAGYGDVEPRVHVMTYNRWMANGRIVRKGEKSVKCGSFALFHISQTDPLPTGAVEPDQTVH